MDGGSTVDRRTMLVSLALSTLFGCGAAPDPKGNAVPARPAWPTWRDRFVQADGRVIDTGNGDVSHSEGQGYALLLAEQAGDRATFDRIWQWTDAVLSRRDVRLFSWRFDANAASPVPDQNNATDGDLLIAWALHRAGRRWQVPDYEAHSRAIRVAVGSRLVAAVQGRIVLLPGLAGFVSADRTTLNLSYYIWPALQAFAAADPQGPWRDVVADGRRLLADARFGSAELPTDWIDLDPATAVRPATGRPARFGFDAIRIPLYLAWAGMTEELVPFQRFWADPANQIGWYDVLSGERAPFPLSAGGKAIVALVERRPVDAVPQDGDDYYAATLLMTARAAARA